MGLERQMGRAAVVCAALLGQAVAARSAPPREPVVVTTLSDPESDLVAADASGPDTSASDRITNFTRALNEAAVAEREAIAARCKSLRVIPVGGSGREAWEANCRYQRR